MDTVFYIDVILISLALWLLWPLFIGAPYVPTPMKRVQKILEIAQVGEGDLLYDLGSGDGRIIIAAGELNADAVGIEADPIRFIISKLLVWMKGLSDKVHVVWGDFFRTQIDGATVVTVYQRNGINNKLEEKLLKELKPETRIVSYQFEFKGLDPIEIDEENKIYFYKIN
jgi:predicted RNA methylase